MEISKEHLEKVINVSSRALVGRVMKRFEIFNNKDDIKRSLKELIYENYRETQALIESFSFGVEFKTRESKESKEENNE